MSKDWEKDLKKIGVRIVSPDGDECSASSIDVIDQYEELKAFIAKHLYRELARGRTQLLKEVRKKVIGKIGTKFHNSNPKDFTQPKAVVEAWLKQEQLKKLKELESEVK